MGRFALRPLAHASAEPASADSLHGSPPIVVVGNSNVPATPYVGAQGMTRQLGSADLLTYYYDGRTACGRGITCTDEAVDHYLSAGIPPPAGTICQPDPTPPKPTIHPRAGN